MKSTTADGSQSQVPPVAPHPRLDRVAAATFEQLSAALIFLSAFSPDAFDYAMDAAESGNDERGATAEAEPVCAACGGNWPPRANAKGGVADRARRKSGRGSVWRRPRGNRPTSSGNNVT